MEGLTATFGPHDENFDFSTIVRDFVTVERYSDALAHCAGCVGKIFGTFSSDIRCLSLACIGVVALAWMCRVTPPRLCQILLLVEKFRLPGESVGTVL